MERLSKEQLDEYLGEEEAKKYYKDLEKYNEGKKVWWSINWRALFCPPCFSMKNGVIEYYLLAYFGMCVMIICFYIDYDGEEPMARYFGWFLFLFICPVQPSKQTLPIKNE